MWALDNRTPFAVDRTWVRDARGRHRWIVVVKATYSVGPRGQLDLADEQLAPRHEPEYHGEPGISSLRYEADLVASKPGTDVIVNASAHAPGGKPVTEVPVALDVAGRRKILNVFGERAYYMAPTGLATTSPVEFTTAPVRYELAFGGSDTEDPEPKRQRIDPANPVGRGVATRASKLQGRPAHRIEYPRGNAPRQGPAGYGALASYWTPRLELAGSYDERWEKNKSPLLPDDYDPRCLLCSPEDQRPPGHVLHGAEVISLVNLTSSGLMRFAIPTERFSFRSLFGRRARTHTGRIATVAIDAEESRVLVTWHTELEVGPLDIERLDRTVINRDAS